MYVKLFASLYQGTLRGKPDEILVFTNMLAHADLNGIVDMHWQAIADETGLPRDRVEAAILTLEMPDPESRSPEMDGSRIVKMDGHRAWGWAIVNYVKYRAIRSEDDRREQNRIAQEKWRCKHYSNQSKQSKPPSAHTEAEADTEATKEREVDKPPRSLRKVNSFEKPTLMEIRAYCESIKASINPVTFYNHYETVGWKVGKNMMKDWKAAIRGWNSRDAK